MVVWSDDLDHIVPLCSEFDEKLMKLVWRSRTSAATSSIITSVSNSSVPSTTASNVNLNEKESARASVTVAEVTAVTAALANKESSTATPAAPPKKKKSWGLNLGWKLGKKKPVAQSSDPEKGSTPQPRPLRLFAPVYSGLGFGLSLCASKLRLPAYLRLTPSISLPLQWYEHASSRMEVGP